MVRALVDGGLTAAECARRYNTTPKTIAKWVWRFREQGVDGLRDRSSRPLSLAGETPSSRAISLPVITAGGASPRRRCRWQVQFGSAPISRLGLTGNNVLRLHN
jgi:transposase-like protein